ncbi:MAG TPA: hypothetical protein VM490_07305 [Armatimonadaceae bacterium]|nr:hypothetical protein [Armatimonadaceae bacterium]
MTHPISRETQPPPPPLQLPAAPRSPAADVEALRQDGETRRRYFAAPLSLVSVNERARIYSRAVNQVICAARGGSAEWLGTRQGIKRVDHERGAVRIYGRGDGLPGDIVRSVVADARGAAALVVTDAGDFAVCLYEPDGDRWRVLGEAPAPDPNWAGRHELARFRLAGMNAPKIAMTPTRVLVAPPFVDVARGQELAFWDRGGASRGAPRRTLAWDEVLRADHPYLVITGLATTGERVWLGTHIGLLAADAKSDGGGAWRRYLPNLAVFRILAPEDQAAEAAVNVYLVAAPRSGDAYQARFVRASLGASSVTAGDEAPTPEGGRVPSPAASAASVGEDGSLWLSRGHGNGFARFNPAAATSERWTYVDEDGTPITSSAVASASGLARRGPMFNPYFPGQEVPVAPAERVPDEAARLRAFSSFPYGSHTNVFPMVGAEPGPPESPFYAEARPMAWVRQRFPHWLSPDAEASEEERRHLGEVAGAYHPSHQFVTDPADPKTAWGIENGPNGSPTLVRLPAADVPGRRRIPGALANGRPVSVYAPVTTPKAERFPVGGRSAPVPVKISGLVAAPGALGLPSGTLIALTSEGVFRVNPGARPSASGGSGVPRWERIGAELPHPYPFSLDGGKLVRAGNGVYFETFLAPKVLRYDRGSGKFVPSTIDRGHAFRGATSAGLWETAYETLATAGGGTTSRATSGLRLAPVGKDGKTAGDWQHVAVPPSPGAGYRERGSNPPLALTGTVAWYTVRRGKTGRERYPNPYDEHTVLVGYDARRRVWTAPLEMPPFENEPPGVTEEGGTTYATFRAPDGCVWRYDSRADRWESVAPNLPPIPGDRLNERSRIRLVDAGSAATGGEVWVMDNRSLARLARGKKEWTRHALPEGLTDDTSNYFALENAVFAADARSVYVGGQQGLYRFDRAVSAWEQTNPSLALGGEGDGGARFSLRAVAADREAVWAVGSLVRTQQQGVLVRLDKKTGKARVLTEAESGLPPGGGWEGIVFDGDAVWVWNGREAALRRDPATGRFARVTPEGGVSASAAISAAAAEVVPDPHDPDSVYVVTGGALLRWSRKAGKVTETVRAASLPRPGNAAGSAAPPRPYSVTPYLSSFIATPKALYLAGMGALYRRERSGGDARWEVVPIPRLWNVQMEEAAGEGIVVSDEQTVVLLRP